MEDIEREKRIIEASRSIFGYAMSRCGNTADAEDLSQEIVCALCASLGELRDERAFYGFMWSVAGNVYSKWFAKRRRDSFIELSAEPPDVPDEEDESEDIFLLRRELSLLSGRYRRAAVLYYIERKSCAEIASVLSVSESMVKYLLFKSRQKLREGMSMQRENGTLSYAPKKFMPMYSGEGSNRFYDFMSTLIRQNILAACVNDEMKAQEISLETGIPLPYLEDEIEDLTEKSILINRGARYTANIPVIDKECFAEAARECAPAAGKLAEEVSRFLKEKTAEFGDIGFKYADRTEMTLRWQLASFLFRELKNIPLADGHRSLPLTGWGERADIWLAEICPENTDVFAYCTIRGNRGGRLMFLDYLPESSNGHRAFYGNSRRVEILFGAVRGESGDFSVYDMETMSELVRMGFLDCAGRIPEPMFPVFTEGQYSLAERIACRFAEESAGKYVRMCFETIRRVISEHVPVRMADAAFGAAAGICFSLISRVCMEQLTVGRTLDPDRYADGRTGMLMVL